MTHRTASGNLSTLDQVVAVDARADGCERCVLEPRGDALLELFCNSAPHICEEMYSQYEDRSNKSSDTYQS